MQDRISFLKEYIEKLNKHAAKKQSLYLDDANLSKIMFEVRQLTIELERLEQVKE